MFIQNKKRFQNLAIQWSICLLYYNYSKYIYKTLDPQKKNGIACTGCNMKTKSPNFFSVFIILLVIHHWWWVVHRWFTKKIMSYLLSSFMMQVILIHGGALLRKQLQQVTIFTKKLHHSCWTMFQIYLYLCLAAETTLTKN